MLIALWALTKSLSPNLLECSTKHCEVWEERRTVFSSTYIPSYLPPQEGSSFWGSGKPKPERSGKEWRGRGAMCGHDALFRKKKKLASWRGGGICILLLGVCATVCCCDKHHDQKHHGQERIDFSFSATVHYEGKLGQEPGGGWS